MLPVLILLLWSIPVTCIFNKGAENKYALILTIKDEEISELKYELKEAKLSNRILNDQVVFLKGNINYHKRIASESRKEKEVMRKILLSEIEHVKDELTNKNHQEIQSMQLSHEEEKKQLIDSMSKTHQKEITEIKNDFKGQIEKSDADYEVIVSELKAKLREAKSQPAPSDDKPLTEPRKSAKQQDISELKRALSSATSETKNNMPPRRPRSSKSKNI